MSAEDNLQDLLEQIDGTANPNDYQRQTALKLLRASKVHIPTLTNNAQLQIHYYYIKIDASP